MTAGELLHSTTNNSGPSVFTDEPELLNALFTICYFFAATFFAATLAGALFTYLKKTGKATKKATQIRYSIPLICV